MFLKSVPRTRNVAFIFGRKRLCCENLTSLIRKITDADLRVTVYNKIMPEPGKSIYIIQA